MSSQTGLQLQVLGGNAAIHGAIVRRGQGDILQITSLPVSSPPVSFQMTSGAEAQLIDKPDLFCVLGGPSGKGEYQLRLEPLPRHVSKMIGSTSLSDGWRFVEECGRTLLRHSYGFATSRWIAVPDSATGSWCLWWYSPNAANMNDFDRYVVVDVEVLGAGDQYGTEDFIVEFTEQDIY